MKQIEMIGKVRDIALQDEAVCAVLMYGSFVKGEGDKYSDIEFYVFIRDGYNVEAREWVSRVEQVDMFFTNEFGTEVAIFANLIRGEFHFQSAKNIDIIRTWQGQTSFEHRGRMNLVDKDGLLAEVLGSIKPPLTPVNNTPENIEWYSQMLLNHLLFERNLIFRGEVAHAYELFTFVHRPLLWLLRIRTSCEQHWEDPFKKLEGDIPPEWYASYAACVPSMDKDSLKECFNNTLELTAVLFRDLAVPSYLSRLLEKIYGYNA